MEEAASAAARSAKKDLLEKRNMDDSRTTRPTEPFPSRFCSEPLDVSFWHKNYYYSSDTYLQQFVAGQLKSFQRCLSRQQDCSSTSQKLKREHANDEDMSSCPEILKNFFSRVRECVRTGGHGPINKSVCVYQKHVVRPVDSIY